MHKQKRSIPFLNLDDDFINSCVKEKYIELIHKTAKNIL